MKKYHKGPGLPSIRKARGGCYHLSFFSFRRAQRFCHSSHFVNVSPSTVIKSSARISTGQGSWYFLTLGMVS